MGLSSAPIGLHVCTLCGSLATPMTAKFATCNDRCEIQGKASLLYRLPWEAGFSVMQNRATIDGVVVTGGLLSKLPREFACYGSITGAKFVWWVPPGQRQIGFDARYAEHVYALLALRTLADAWASRATGPIWSP